jgi:hypothetical protein
MLMIDGTERERGASRIYLNSEPFWLPVEPFALLVYLSVGTATQSQPVSPPWGNVETMKYSVKSLRSALPLESISFLPARSLGYDGHGYRLNLTAREILWNHPVLARHSDYRVRAIFCGEVPSLPQVA